MAASLLHTKLHIPTLRSALVSRPHLIARLNAGLSSKITLVAAPAGFGKTTLVTTWLEQLPAGAFPWQRGNCAWVSLDDNDDDPLRFLTYLITAVQHIYPAFGEILLPSLQSASQIPNIEVLTHSLINDLTELAAPVLLILDDYHVITNPEIHRMMDLFIDRSPSQVHTVIASRYDPPLSLPRWRVRGHLHQITTDDLRFSEAEASNFFQQTMAVALDAQAVAALEDRTEGWVAGLQLAALSLRSTQDPVRLIAAFTGRDRHVADYLLTEVLDHQPTDVQRFLLETAVLERFTASLCDAVRTTPENKPLTPSRTILENLERNNLFIVPLDNERTWYRYHHLFAQLLRQRLEQEQPNAPTTLHQRAAAWYEAEGLVNEAIGHALKAADFDNAARLITTIPFEALWTQETGNKMLHWARTIPDTSFEKYPRALVWITVSHLLRGEIEGTRRFLGMMANDPRIEPHYKAIQSNLIRNDGDVPQALAVAQSSLESLPDDDLHLKAIARLQMAVCLLELGRFDEAETVINSQRKDLRLSDPGTLNTQLQAIQMLGIVQYHRGKLVEAQALYQEGIDLIEQSGIKSPLIGIMQANLAKIHFEWNELETAEQYYDAAMVWGERTGITDILFEVLQGRMRLAAWRMDRETVMGILDQMLAFTRQADLSSILTINEALKAAYQLHLGMLNEAVRWANASGLQVTDSPDFQNYMLYQLLLSIRLAESRVLEEISGIHQLIKLANQLIATAEKAGAVLYVVQTLLLKVEMFDLQGKTRQAVDALHHALDLAKPGGLTRVFLAGGRPMQALLQKALAYDMEHRIAIRRLLFAFDAEPMLSAPAPTPTPQSSTPALPEPLTEREVEVLGLIAAGLSNKAIEEALTVSKNTVRSHIKNIYRKLDVENRTQAAKRAQDLNLL